MGELRYNWFHLARAARFRLEKMTMISGLSLRQLQRRLRTDLGRSPEEWLNEQRMVAARYFLVSDMPIKEMAFELGYATPNHFYRHFKTTYGATPLEIRTRQKSEECRPGVINVAVG